jgi:hypothetical protein
LTSKEVCPTPSLKSLASMPWWWIVWTFFPTDSSVTWTICPSRTRMVGEGKDRVPRSSWKPQNSTSSPSGMVSLSLKKSRTKAMSGFTLPGVFG